MTPKSTRTSAAKKTPAARKSSAQKTPAKPRPKRAASDAEPTPRPGELLGAHVSIAGGTQEAPVRAAEIGATAIQMFTKMANRWAERAVDAAEATAFKAALAKTDVVVTVVHDSYLINLASPDPVLRRRSIESFVAELERCNALGITYLVSHPGNFMDERAAGIQRNADAITEALERVKGKTLLCMETTAGAGTVIGSTFEELAQLLELVAAPQRRRMGICLDTCHAYSAGYDLVRDFDGVWAHFDDVLGAARLRVLHLNDSKMPFDSRRDRHELIGEGTLGPGPFRRIMTGDRFFGVAKVLETPKLDDATKTDRTMLARLRGYAAGR